MHANSSSHSRARGRARTLFSCGLGLGLICFRASADPVPGVSLTISGTVSFDRNNTFGWRFTPTIDIDVTALSYFDATTLPAGSGTGLSQSHTVGIYRVSDQLLMASNTIPAGTVGVPVGNFRYVALDTPVRLSAGTTYLMAGFALSASPDPAAAATMWMMPRDIIYANVPTPTIANPTTGTSQYLVSAHGNPPAVLTYPALAQTAILPVFAANFQYTVVAPRLTGITFTNNAVALTMTDLTPGVTNWVEQSADLGTWLPLLDFVPGSAATNLVLDATADPIAFYRIRVAR
jgi:hypothetical protein